MNENYDDPKMGKTSTMWLILWDLPCITLMVGGAIGTAWYAVHRQWKWALVSFAVQLVSSYVNHVVNKIRSARELSR